ncbi:outer membrane lipoprotein carrier protein LolA [Desulfobulbus sp.]|uniref:outer membrane lipoprotein carrier protein LolA n=1 Tax=Desulfobulbus sp. TaxID=895 RepID=UPI00286F11F5|nr:outer membrane lipoprotein carrier protein LolA [Desulfobulbus sp.]
MSARLVWCLMLSLLLGATVARGDGADAASTRLRSVQADFTQEKHLAILTRPLISRGTLAFQAPGSLRWEYLRPIHTVLLLHDGRIDKLIERDGRFERDNGAGVDAMRTVLQDIGSWLDGRFGDNPLFAVSRTGAQTLVLTPREPGLETVIKRIELRLGAQEGVMDRITIVEGDEAVTVLTFSQVILNRDIPAQRFAVP